MEAEPCKICGQADEDGGLLRCCEKSCTMLAHPDCLPPQAKLGVGMSVQDWRCLGCRTKSAAGFRRDRDSEDELKSEGEALKKRGGFNRGRKRGGGARDLEEHINGPVRPKRRKRFKEEARQSGSEVAGETLDGPQRQPAEKKGKKTRRSELHKTTKGLGRNAIIGGGRQGRGRVHAETPEETSSNSIPIIALDEACDVCGKEENEELILHCTAKGCEILTHTYCCGPPLETAPEGDWVCPQCIAKHAKRKSQDKRRKLEEGGSGGLETKASEGERFDGLEGNASADKMGVGSSEEKHGRRRKRTGGRGVSVFDWAEGPGIESAGPSKVVGDWGRCIVKEGEAQGDESRCKNRRAPGKLCCQMHSEWRAESHAKVAKGTTQVPQNAGGQGIEGSSKSGDKSQGEGNIFGEKQGRPGAGTRLSGGVPGGGAAKPGASQATATAAQKLGTAKRGGAGPFVRAKGVIDDGIRCTNYGGTIATGIWQCKNARVSGKLSCQMHLERGRAKTRARKRNKARRARGSANVNSSSGSDEHSDGDSRADSAVHPDATCDVCGSAGRDDVMLLCSNLRCDSRRHTFCCDPPLGEVPEGHWFCGDCPGTPEAGEKDASQGGGGAAEREETPPQEEPKRGQEAKCSGVTSPRKRKGDMFAPVAERIYDGVRCTKLGGKPGRLRQCTRPRKDEYRWCEYHHHMRQKASEAGSKVKGTGRRRWPLHGRGREEKGGEEMEEQQGMDGAGAKGILREFEGSGGVGEGDPSGTDVAEGPRGPNRRGSGKAAEQTAQSCGDGENGRDGDAEREDFGDRIREGRQRPRLGGANDRASGVVDDGVRCLRHTTHMGGLVNWQCRKERLPGCRLCSQHSVWSQRKNATSRARPKRAAAGTEGRQLEAGESLEEPAANGKGKAGAGGEPFVAGEKRGAGNAESDGGMAGEGSEAGCTVKRRKESVESATEVDAAGEGKTGADGSVPETEPEAACPVSETLDTFRSKPKALRAGKIVAGLALPSPPRMTGSFSTSPPGRKRKSARLSQTTPAEDSPGQGCIVLNGGPGEDSPGSDHIILTKSPKAPGEDSPDSERTNPNGNPTSLQEKSPGREPILPTGAPTSPENHSPACDHIIPTGSPKAPGEDSADHARINPTGGPTSSRERDSPGLERIFPSGDATSAKEGFPGPERTNLTRGPTTKPATFKNSGASAESAESDLGRNASPRKPVDEPNLGGETEGEAFPSPYAEWVRMREADSLEKTEGVERNTAPRGGAEERAAWEREPAGLREIVAQELRKLFAGALDFWSQSGEAQRRVCGGGAAGGLEMPRRMGPPERKSGPEEENVGELPEKKSAGGKVRAHELERDNEGGLFEEANEADPSSGHGEEADSEAKENRTGEKRGLLSQQAVEDRAGGNVAKVPETEDESLGVERSVVGDQDFEKAGKRAQLSERSNPEDTPVRRNGEGAKVGPAAEAPATLPLADGQPQPATNESEGGRQQITPCHSVEAFIDLEQAPKLNQDQGQHTDGGSTVRPTKAQCTDGPETKAASRQPGKEKAADSERHGSPRASTPSVLPGSVPVKVEPRSTIEKSPNQEPGLSLFSNENNVEPPTALEIPHSRSAGPKLGSEHLCADTKPLLERSGEKGISKDGGNAGHGQLEKLCFRSEDATRAGGAQLGAGSAEQGAPGSCSVPEERRRWKDSWKKPKLDIHGLR